VVTVGPGHRGQRVFNIISRTRRTWRGTVRTYDETRGAHVGEPPAREIVEELPRAFGAVGHFRYERGFPSTINDRRGDRHRARLRCLGR